MDDDERREVMGEKWMKLGGEAWVTVDDDGPTAMLHPEDIDSFPPMVEARDTIDRLTAENERLREASNTLAALRADAIWMARLARGSSWPGEMAHQVQQGADRVLALLGALDDQTERWLERAKANALPGPKHAAPSPVECEYLPGTIGAESHCNHWLWAETPCCWCGSDEDDSGSCPGPSTGEDGGHG
jgi:hypothetical protein